MVYPTTTPNNIPVLTEILDSQVEAQETFSQEPALTLNQDEAGGMRELDETMILNMLQSLESSGDPSIEHHVNKLANEIAQSISNSITLQLRERISTIVSDAMRRALDRELKARKLR